MCIDPEVLFCVTDGLLCFSFIKFGLHTQMMMDEVSRSLIHQRDFQKEPQDIFQLSGMRSDVFWAVYRQFLILSLSLHRA